MNKMCMEGVLQEQCLFPEDLILLQQKEEVLQDRDNMKIFYLIRKLLQDMEWVLERLEESQAKTQKLFLLQIIILLAETIHLTKVQHGSWEQVKEDLYRVVMLIQVQELTLILSQQEDQLLNEKTPGPGQYTPHPDTVREKAPTYRIGTEEKIQRDRTTRKLVPGPGQYENPKTKCIKASPSYGFGTGKRDPNKKSSAPGPGQYHIPCKIVEVPRYLNTKQQEEFRFI